MKGAFERLAEACPTCGAGALRYRSGRCCSSYECAWHVRESAEAEAPAGLAAALGILRGVR